MRRVGLTTTVPVEVILAAGAVPVDLNNRFITHPRREALIQRAENEGFPANLCAWVKGIYGVALEEGIEEVVGVTRGDCSSTEKLLEVLRLKKVTTIPFAFPESREPTALAREINKMMNYFRVSQTKVEKTWLRLRPIREKLRQLDDLTWKACVVSGKENHLWLVSASDFWGEPDRFAADLEAFLKQAEQREPLPGRLRLGLLGVPPIYDDLYDLLEQLGARVVFNEVQRQFAMLEECQDMLEQYLRYTYPYDTFGRIVDILRQVQARGITALVHYAQSFCHRQIEGILFREKLGLPLLAIEGDRPAPLDQRTRTRVQAFLEML